MTTDPTPTTLADTATQSWRAAAAMQAAAVPEHGDFYALAAELVGTLRALERLVNTVNGQVARYGVGRVLRDDENVLPSRRIAEAGARLDVLAVELHTAAIRAGHFWSAIGHIGVVGEGT